MITIKETKKCNELREQDPSKLTTEVVEKETKDHIAAVRKCMAHMAEKMLEQAKEHDHTKLGEYLPEFTEELANGFKTEDWFKKHTELERHHLSNHVPDDVNLIDVIEMVCDCVCAGMARKGTFDSSYTTFDPKVLQKAIENTQNYLVKNIKVVK